MQNGSDTDTSEMAQAVFTQSCIEDFLRDHPRHIEVSRSDRETVQKCVQKMRALWKISEATIYLNKLDG
jgi:hypothetical protein